jgi:hypothetical protein
VTAGYLLALLKRKPYCTIAELRRRIEPGEEEEEMLPITTLGGNAWVGLPETHARLLSDLESQGKVGLEISVEFDARVVIGVYAPSRAAQAQLNRRRGQRPLAAGVAAREQAARPTAESAAVAIADDSTAGSSAA